MRNEDRVWDYPRITFSPFAFSKKSLLNQPNTFYHLWIKKKKKKLIRVVTWCFRCWFHMAKQQVCSHFCYLMPASSQATDHFRTIMARIKCHQAHIVNHSVVAKSQWRKGFSKKIVFHIKKNCKQERISEMKQYNLYVCIRETSFPVFGKRVFKAIIEIVHMNQK